ncbi:MAG: hypothetical protein ABFR36_05955 [Acidobacteriota bacterium]
MSRIPDFEKAINPDSLSKIVNDNPEKRIILTGGVFDLLKPFHIDLIEFADNRGDILVVAVEVEGRYTPLEERIEILNEIEKINYLLTYKNRSVRSFPQDLFKEIIVNEEFNPIDIISGFSGKIIRFPV